MRAFGVLRYKLGSWQVGSKILGIFIHTLISFEIIFSALLCILELENRKEVERRNDEKRCEKLIKRMMNRHGQREAGQKEKEKKEKINVYKKRR